MYDWTRAVFPDDRVRWLFNACLLTIFTMVFAVWLVVAFSWWQVGWAILAFVAAVTSWYRYRRVSRT